jgi:hypothetical protein
MAAENGVIQTLLTGATIVGLLGYIGHTVYTGYSDFKKSVYTTLSEKVAKVDCKDWRDTEKEARIRIDDDLQQHKEEK